MSPQPAPWTPLGAFVVPNGQVGTTSDTLSAPVSGRVSGLWADPADPAATLYVATAAGGLWHTADGGVTWTPLLDAEATLATGAVTAAKGIVYVGTGEANYGGDNVAGHGVITIDVAAGTRTYDYLPQFAGQVISRLTVDDPAAPALLYVASSNGLWRKDLASGTWKELPVTGFGTGQDVTDVLVNPAGRIYAGVNGRGVFTSDQHDALVRVKESVANLPTAVVGRVALSMCHNAAQTIYAAIVDAAAPRGVRIFRCDNAPQAQADSPAASLWNAVTPPKGMEQLWYTNVLAVHPRDADIVFYGDTHLWRSRDGGGTWERSTNQHGQSPGAHADQHALVIQDEPLTTPKSFDGIKMWAGNDGGVWRSVDGGGTWKPRNRGLNTMQYFGLATHPAERNVVVAGAQDNGTQRYLGDAAWELADYGDGCYVAFDPVDPTVWYNGYLSYGQSGASTRTTGFSGFQVSTKSGQLGSYHTVAGRSGSANAIGATDEALFYAPFQVVPPTGGATAADIWVGTDRLYYSNSRGERWFAVTASLLTTPLVPNTRNRGVSVVAIPSGAGGRVYAGTSEGRFYRIDQVGGAWSSSATTTEQMQAGSAPPVPVLQAAGMPARSFLSAIAAARLPSGDDRVVVGVGRNHIVGSALSPFPPGSHLFVSSDSGATFTAVALPDVPVPGLPGTGKPGAANSVNGLVIDPANPDIVFIACDTGVFRYDVSTPAVAPDPWMTGLPNTVVMGIELVASAPRLLRVATHGRGAWETVVDGGDAPGSAVEVVVRDTLHDDGRAPSPASSPDPFETGGTLNPLTSLDIVVDAPGYFSGEYTVTSTVDYQPAGKLDYIGFHDLGGGESPIRGATVKVHVRVHNRGSAPATAVTVALAWADNAHPIPLLPAGFFAAFPGGPLAGGTAWPAIGAPVTIDRIGPGESGVATFDWPVSSDMPGKARLLAVVSSTEDPFVDPAETGSAAAAMKSRYVAVRDVEVTVDTTAWVIVLVAVGLLAATAVVIAETQ